LIDEGRDLGGVEAEFERLLADDQPEDEQFQKDVNTLLDRGQDLPLRPDYPYIEPSDLPAIRSERSSGPRKLALDLPYDVRSDRIAGAWLGRCAGCLLGKPVEGTHRQRLKELLAKAGCSGIPDYLWQLPGMTQQDYTDVDFAYIWDFFRQTSTFPGDDDTNYTVTGLALLKDKGIAFTPSDMAQFWMANLPILRTFTAERVAYRNFVDGIAPPASASFRNPYRELIGAQIRADVFGYVALGNPELAAELAWRDACISHVKNGIYGAMWAAAMLAAAIVETDIRRIVEIGLTEIPGKSRLHEAIVEILDRQAAGASYSGMVDYIHGRWDETRPDHWCHTVSNAQIVAMALLYSEGDYEKAITGAVLPCFDTDSNGATVGSIIGMMLGAKSLPTKWTGVMNDTIHTDVQGYQEVSILGLAEEMFQLHRKAEQVSRCT
jgi:ADP-ribosylglycohydrolase